MSKIILFLLGFAVGTLVHCGWKYLSKARKRDINSRIERGRKTVARMERRPKRTATPLCDSLHGATASFDELAKAANDLARRAGRSSDEIGGPT